MKSISVLIFSFLTPGYFLSQVQIDKPVELTGGNGDRAVRNLELPVNGTDAAKMDARDALQIHASDMNR